MPKSHLILPIILPLLLQIAQSARTGGALNPEFFFTKTTDVQYSIDQKNKMIKCFAIDPTQGQHGSDIEMSVYPLSKGVSYFLYLKISKDPHLACPSKNQKSNSFYHSKYSNEALSLFFPILAGQRAYFVIETEEESLFNIELRYKGAVSSSDSKLLIMLSGVFLAVLLLIVINAKVLRILPMVSRVTNPIIIYEYKNEQLVEKVKLNRYMDDQEVWLKENIKLYNQSKGGEVVAVASAKDSSEQQQEKNCPEQNGSNSSCSEDNSNEEQLCSICYERQSSIKFEPCNHSQTCIKCALLVFVKDPRCPMCRETIDKLIDNPNSVGYTPLDCDQEQEMTPPPLVELVQ